MTAQYGELIDKQRLEDYDGALEQKIADTYAEKGDVPTKTSDLANDSGFIAGYATVGDLPSSAPQAGQGS